MIRQFTLIASLPRSRTAWLSAWLSGGPCYAFHDAAGDDNLLLSEDAYLARLEAREERFVVDCSSGVVGLPGHVRGTTGPIIWIERDPYECRESFLEHISQLPHGITDPWPKILAARDQFLALNNARIKLRIPFADLSKVAMCAKIWALCCPGAPFDKQRCEAFQRLTIQEVAKWVS